MLWQPTNVTAACPADAHVTACSQFGVVYLSLLVRLFGTPIDTAGVKYCDERHHTNKREYDFIVVGGGTAGCVVANRLTENPDWNVLLVEAGPEQPQVTLVPALFTALLGSNVDWGYMMEPNGRSCLARVEGRCTLPGGRMMGGSSSINSMEYIRGNKLDYDNWYDLGNPGWRYDEVLPFFKKFEKNLNIEALDREYHGVDGEVAVSRFPYIDQPSVMMIQAYNERGLPLTDYNAAEQEGTMQAQAFSKDGERVSSNTAFILPIKNKRKNLTVKVNSEVIEIIIEDGGAVGVKYEHEGEQFSVRARKEVILSAGSINSPKLLMLSGVGPQEHLEGLGISVKSNLSVGQNLQDHISFTGIIVALPNKTATLVDQDEILDNLVEYKNMEIKTGPISANGPENSLAFFKSDPHLSAPDLMIEIDDVTYYKEYIQDPILFESVRFFPTEFYDALLLRPTILTPRSRGYLLLNPTDPRGPPRIQANYLQMEEDLLPLLRGTTFLLSLENTTAFKANGAHFVRDPMPACKDYMWGTEEYYICVARSYTTSAYHPVGTCKMGPRWDTTAVVDNELRVYGIRNLRVVDASVMPVIPRGNPEAASLMVGERGVDFIIKYWKRLKTI